MDIYQLANTCLFFTCESDLLFDNDVWTISYVVQDDAR